MKKYPNQMRQQYHILNGDALKEQFPKTLSGEKFVARECLVDGPVDGNSLEELFATRANFISSHYQGCTKQEYLEKTVSEFHKMQGIGNNAEVNLWFEDDLFCQVNFWFVVYLLNQSPLERTLYLVRPPEHTPYGFGKYSHSELISLYEQRTLISQLTEIGSLWEAYQKQDFPQLLKTAKSLVEQYPFLLTAVQAHIERIPSAGNLGRPSQSLVQIMEELNTQEFGPVFKAFNQRESIYGFGDLQVKRLFDELKPT